MGTFLRTTLLLGTLTGLLLAAGWLIGGTGGAIFALFFAAIMNFGSYWFSDKIVLRMSGAHEVDRNQAPRLYAMVEDLADNAKLPMPKVYVIQTDVPNAFATGRSPRKAAVAATTGIMRVLSEEELRGVMAHELAHVKNRDTLISAVAATIAGAISLLANMAQWALIFGGFSRDGDGGGAGNIVGALVLIIVAPIAAVIVQMAISRSREFAADREGAEISGDARGLANALIKIENYVKGHQQMDVNAGTAHMYIINPLKGGISGLFSTHPDTEKRVERLKQIAEKQGHVML
jgi:heat shock protein HtpX